MDENQFLSALGARIRSLRVEQSMSQTEFACKCAIEKASMSRIESGKTNPTIRTLKRTSDTLGLDLSTLLLQVGAYQIGGSESDRQLKIAR